MIHENLIKDHIAARYYAKKGRSYTPHQAGKQFHQDRHIDVRLMIEVANEVHKEWMAILKKELKLTTKK